MQKDSLLFNSYFFNYNFFSQEFNFLPLTSLVVYLTFKDNSERQMSEKFFLFTVEKASSALFLMSSVSLGDLT